MQCILMGHKPKSELMNKQSTLISSAQIFIYKDILCHCIIQLWGFHMYFGMGIMKDLEGSQVVWKAGAVRCFVQLWRMGADC